MGEASAKSRTSRLNPRTKPSEHRHSRAKSSVTEYWDEWGTGAPEAPDFNSPDFAALTRQHQDSVYRQMVRVCGNREDAEDVLVEALLKAYRRLDQLRDSVAFRAWLARIAKRVCWQLKEREALLPLLQLSTLEEEGREIPGGDLTPEGQLARRQMKQCSTRR